ncbi:MAG: LacI family DNA-binding transcriptional regulator [Steroidobacteraceae bacterium]
MKAESTRGKRPARVTARDVAERAGVDTSTVSRALNPETRHLISDKAVLRVIDAAKALGYRKNKMASALTHGRSQVIGVMLPDIENSVFPPIIRGLEERLTVDGYGVLIANAAGAPADHERVLEQMFEHQVDGLVVATARRDDQVVRRCILEHMPVVLVNRSDDHPQAPEVVNDDHYSMQLAVSHLVALGHKKIAHVAGPSQISTGFARLQGFQAAAQKHNVSANRVVECTEFTRNAGRVACAELLKRYRDTTAIVAANDLVALGCYDLLTADGLSCPRDISIVGHNDIPLVDMINPPLTTLRIQHREMGRRAAQLLLERLASPEAKPIRVTLSPELIVRSSTAAPRAG